MSFNSFSLWLILFKALDISHASCPMNYAKSLSVAAELFTIADSSIESDEDLVTLMSLGGTIARLTSPKIYRTGDAQYDTWLEDIQKKTGVSIDEKYSNDVSGLIDYLINSNAGIIKGVAVFETVTDVTLSQAITFCSGSDGVFAISRTNLDFYSSKYGVTVLFDATAEELPMDRLTFSENSVTFQEPGAQLYLIEYSIFAKAPFMAWDSNLRDGVLESLSASSRGCAAAFGWVGDEGSYVSHLSSYGVWAHASDWAKNMVALSNIDVPIVQVTVDVESRPASEKVHTVTFVMTDGDNLQWMLGSFLQESWYGSADVESTPMGFTLTPSLKDISAITLSHIYESASTKNITSFVSSPSGLGYIYPELLFEDVLSTFAAETASSMRATGMNILNILAGSDVTNEQFLRRSSEPFLNHSEVDAVFYYTYGEGYAGGGGKAFFAFNGKPIITARFSLWDENDDPSESPMLSNDGMIKALQSQTKDISQASGYSVIPVHAWSHTTSDVKYIMDNLEEGVEVLTPAAFIKRFVENVH